jgi:glucosyl-3-phosphoglycerate phosphatase
LIAERFSFICDIGSPVADLRAGWPDGIRSSAGSMVALAEETEKMIRHRSPSFWRRFSGELWSQIGVVTHWGFIRALTGLKVPNGAVLRIDPTRPRRKPELLFVPDAG